LSIGSIWTATRKFNPLSPRSRLPGVDDVAWPEARRKQQHVDPRGIAVAQVAVGDGLYSVRDTAQAVFVDRHVALGRRGPPLDLDEGDGARAAGDDVDLAARRLDALIENPPALQPKPPGGEALAFAPPPLGLLPLHFSSSARA